MRFEIVRSRSKKEPFFWRIVASNGQTLATSEISVQKASCLSAIASVQKSAGGTEVLDTTV